MKTGWDLRNIKQTKFCVKGVPEGEERENGLSKNFKN